MSLFSWLSSRNAKPEAENSVSARTEPNRLATVAPDASTRKSERMARRELLYSVVRESMARAGVLSASYKFKVLSLDSAGRQFLVMVDLAPSERADADLFGEIEAGIAQRAKSRHELMVSAVYWRRNDQVGVAAARQQARSLPAAPSQPAELNSEPAALRASAPAASNGVGFDPIMDDEMEAFKAALASAKAMTRTPGAKEATRAVETPRQPTGFEETQIRPDEPRTRTLSPTQSGDLN